LAQRERAQHLRLARIAQETQLKMLRYQLCNPLSERLDAALTVIVDELEKRTLARVVVGHPNFGQVAVLLSRTSSYSIPRVSLKGVP
jgi:hypothetical protein